MGLMGEQLIDSVAVLDVSRIVSGDLDIPDRCGCAAPGTAYMTAVPSRLRVQPLR
jgi:hypothetical protein